MDPAIARAVHMLVETVISPNILFRNVDEYLENIKAMENKNIVRVEHL